jgi:hypothetical protein
LGAQREELSSAVADRTRRRDEREEQVEHGVAAM